MLSILCWYIPVNIIKHKICCLDVYLKLGKERKRINDKIKWSMRSKKKNIKNNFRITFSFVYLINHLELILSRSLRILFKKKREKVEK